MLSRQKKGWMEFDYSNGWFGKIPSTLNMLSEVLLFVAQIHGAYRIYNWRQEHIFPMTVSDRQE